VALGATCLSGALPSTARSLAYLSRARTHFLRLGGHGLGGAGSAWDDLESLLYVLLYLHLGADPWQPAPGFHSGSADSEDEEHLELAIMKSKQQWLYQAATDLPEPVEALRIATGERLRSIDEPMRFDVPDNRAVPPPFAAMLALFQAS
jgi:hypothetical protein